MTPREVEQLTFDEYEAMVRYANHEARELRRAQRKAAKR
jgi:hypothetical protein